MAVKQRTYDLAATNIAGLGTDLEKKVRLEAAQGELAWKDCGKTIGLQIWRIEQFKVVPWPKNDYGSFFGDDSYVCLHTYHPKPGLAKIAHNIHFWIGETSSQDEYGTAAYKTVELDDFLGGEPVQYREVQFHESNAFRNLFPAINYWMGGAATGFKHIEAAVYRPRLLWIKQGHGKITTQEVPISCTSLNDGDSFIFDGGLRLLVWHGRETSIFEKHKATAMAQAIDDQRHGKCQREVFDHGICDETEWWAALGGKGPVAPAVSDAESPARLQRLLQLSDKSGKLTLTEIAVGGQIKRTLLTSDDIFILDEGSEVTVWIGLNASVGERKNGLSRAIEYLVQEGRPLTTPIARILEGGENEQFENFFDGAVTSMRRPGEGVRFTGDLSQIRKLQTTGVVHLPKGPLAPQSLPGAVTDFDQLYKASAASIKQEEEWTGRTKPTSHYAQQLAARANEERTAPTKPTVVQLAAKFKP